MPGLFRYTFDYALRAFLLLMPFITVLSIFFRERLGVPWISFLKELIILSMLLSIVYAHVSGIYKIRWTRYDGIIFSYIVVLVTISFFTTGISGIIYGWRYDFSFIIVFFIVYHGSIFLAKPVSYYIRLFLLSGGVMIFISMLLKWPFSEDLLLYLGYSGNPSNWQFGSSVPIFHWVDWANVRRFQWLLDGPNTMGAFLIVYTGILVHFFRNKKEWHFFIGCVIFGLLALIFYTYSRSAVLWFFWWVGFITLFLLRDIYKKYRVEFFTVLIIFIILIGWIFLQYAGNMRAIIERGWSTNGHLERMSTGIHRFIEKPFWQWLGSAWPGYRYVENLGNKSRTEIEEMDRFYIPESWYIQQLVEWWIFGFIAFMTFILSLFFAIFRRDIIVAWMFLAILIMNFFLHTFESSVVALTLFAFIGLILWYKNRHHAYEK